MPRRPGALSALIVLILLSLALSQSVEQIRSTNGIDFYQYWGVPVALRLAGDTLGPPYTNGWRYTDTLTAYAATVDDPKLKAANRFWKGPDFAASPLLYTAFTWVSSSYTVSLIAFQTLQFVLFLGSFLLLGYLSRLDPLCLACLALLLVLCYQPLLSDVRVANLGCWQLASLTGLLVLAGAAARAASFNRRATLGAVFLAALAALTLAKPNVAVISAVLATHLVARHGSRLFIVAALPAAAAAAVLAVIPCMYFGSWTVWRDWYDVVYGSNSHMLVRPVAHGNYATALLLSSRLGLDVYVASTALLATLGASLLAAAAWSHAPHPAVGSPAGSAALQGLRRIFVDPQMALAIGIVLTMAASPLYWAHYYVLSLVPALWLLGAPASTKSLAVLAAGAVVMSSGILAPLFWWLHRPDALPPSIALSWLPLWCAILLRITSPDVEVAMSRETRAAAGVPGRSGRARQIPP